MSDHIQQVADSAAGATVVAAASVTYLADVQSAAVAFSAIAAGLWYVTKFAPIWWEAIKRWMRGE